MMIGRHLAGILVTLFFMTSAAYPNDSSDRQTKQTIKPVPEKKQVRAEKDKRAEDKVLDKDVAAELEMLKLMDMLEHIDLLDDMDVLGGGTSK